MEQENKPFVHDTINLDEIRALLADHDTPQPKQEPEMEAEPQPQAAEVPPEEKPVLGSKADQEKEKETKVPGEEAYGLIHDVVYILAVVTVLFTFIVRLVGVDGESMLPTLHNMDFLLLESNFLYSTDDIENGDIVVLKVPYFENEPIVKRVVATEGQTVDIDFSKGEVYVDGVLQVEDYINAPTYNNFGDYGLAYPATVPEGCIFVLGDNRNDSTDSRFALVGMIDTRCVIGKVLAVVLPGQSRDGNGNVTDPRDWSRIGLVS